MNEGKIIFIVVIMMVLLGFGIDLYSPSFPAMTQFFHTTDQLIQLTITTYFGGYVIGMVVFGPLMDAMGRKKPLLWGLFFYALVSLGCPFAPNIHLLLFFRFLQGVCISLIGVGFRSILADVFTGKKLATSLNYASMSYRASPVIAPFIGGFLEVYFGWAYNFYLLALLGLAILMIVVFFLPETHFELHPFRIKTIASNYHKILKYPIIIGAGCCIGINYGVMIIFNLIGPFFIQTVLKLSPIIYGNIALIVGIAALLGSLLNKHLLRKHSTVHLTKIGVYSFLALTLIQSLLSLLFPLNLLCFILPVIVVFLVGGLISSNMTTLVLESIPGTKGTTSATLGILIIITTTILTALSTFLKSTTIRPFAFSYFALAILMSLIYYSSFKKKVTHK